MSESFHTDKTAVRQAFDHAAQSYDAAAVVQHEIVARMLERLDIVKQEPVRILDAGCGTGSAYAGLHARYPQASIVALDLAEGMLQVCRSKQEAGWRSWLGLSRPTLFPLCGDLEQLPLANNSVDFIWSSLALQWCNTPDAAFAEFQRVLKPGGLLMFATLGPDTLRELRHAFAGVDEHQHVNRFIDMHDLGDALQQQGFAGPVMDMEYITLTYARVADVLRDLKDIGANNHMQGRPAGLMGRQAWRQIEARYEELRRDGVLPCTYEVIYGHAWKSERARNAADGAQIIEFYPRKGAQ